MIGSFYTCTCGEWHRLASLPCPDGVPTADQVLDDLVSLIDDVIDAVIDR